MIKFEVVYIQQTYRPKGITANILAISIHCVVTSGQTSGDFLSLPVTKLDLPFDNALLLSTVIIWQIWRALNRIKWISEIMKKVMTDITPLLYLMPKELSIVTL